MAWQPFAASANQAQTRPRRSSYRVSIPSRGGFEIGKRKAQSGPPLTITLRNENHLHRHMMRWFQTGTTTGASDMIDGPPHHPCPNATILSHNGHSASHAHPSWICLVSLTMAHIVLPCLH
jgi:hypothetical protein